MESDLLQIERLELTTKTSCRPSVVLSVSDLASLEPRDDSKQKRLKLADDDASGLRTAPSTVDREAFDLRLERRVSQKTEQLLVDEPDSTPKITLPHETRNVEQPTRHDNKPTESVSVELLDSGDVPRRPGVGTASVNEPGVTGRSDSERPQAGYLDSVGNKSAAAAGARDEKDSSPADHDASSPRRPEVDAAAAVAAAASGDLDNNYDEDELAESDSGGTRRHLPPTNASSDPSRSGKPGVGRAVDENDNVGRASSSTSSRVGGESPRSVDADDSVAVGTVQPGGGAVERPRLHADDKLQSAGDRRRELLGGRSGDARPDFAAAAAADEPPPPGSPPLREPPGSAVETSSPTARRPDDERTLSTGDEDKTGVEAAPSEYRAVDPALSTHADEANSERDSDVAPSDGRRLEDGGGSPDGPSAEKRSPAGWKCPQWAEKLSSLAAEVRQLATGSGGRGMKQSDHRAASSSREQLDIGNERTNESRLGRKFVTKSYLSTPPHPKRVATLPREISVFKK